MTEVVGLTASIADLASIAFRLGRSGYEYIREVRHADSSVRDLINKVNELSDVLHSLKDVADRYEKEKTLVDPATQTRSTEQCLKTLGLVEDLLDELDPVQGLNVGAKIIKKVKWPFDKARVQELMNHVDHHKSVMVLATKASSMSALLVLLEGQANLQGDLRALTSTFQGEIARSKSIKVTDEQTRLLSRLTKVNFLESQRSNFSLRQPGTANWFIRGDAFQTWIKTDRAKLWVHGIAGAGKTILMSTAIHEASKLIDDKHALAYFYCDYKNIATHDPRNILGSIAQQLAMQNVACFNPLKAIFDETWLDDDWLLTQDQLRDLVQKFSTLFSTVMVIVDGLDEVSGSRSDVAELLQSLNQPDGTIKTLFASRKEVELEYPLRSFPQSSIAATSTDLQLYVAAEIEKRIEKRKLHIHSNLLKDDIIKTLIAKAEGMFRWVACQIDYLCECFNESECREALQKLPPDLTSSYERILSRINNCPNPEISLLIINTLRWVIDLDFETSMIGYVSLEHKQLQLSKTPGCLLEALSVNDGDVKIDPKKLPELGIILRWASSLLRISNDRLELAHFTVKEFLLTIDPNKTPTFARYVYRPVEARRYQIKTSLTFLMSRTVAQVDIKSHEDFQDFLRRHPFWMLASMIWLEALQHIDDMHWVEEDSLRADLSSTIRFGSNGRFKRCCIPVLYNYLLSNREWMDFHHIDGTPLFDGWRRLLANFDLTPLQLALLLQKLPMFEWLYNYDGYQGLGASDSDNAGYPIYYALLGTKSLVSWEGRAPLSMNLIHSRPDPIGWQTVNAVLQFNKATRGDHFHTPFNICPGVSFSLWELAIHVGWPELLLVSLGVNIKEKHQDDPGHYLLLHLMPDSCDLPDDLLYSILVAFSSQYRHSYKRITPETREEVWEFFSQISNLSEWSKCITWDWLAEDRAVSIVLSDRTEDWLPPPIIMEDIRLLFPLLAEVVPAFRSPGHLFSAMWGQTFLAYLKSRDSDEVTSLLENCADPKSLLSEPLGIHRKGDHRHIISRIDIPFIENLVPSVTPFHMAAQHGAADVLEFLWRICQDASVLSLQDAYGRTPYDYACQKDHVEIANTLAFWRERTPDREREGPIVFGKRKRSVSVDASSSSTLGEASDDEA